MRINKPFHLFAAAGFVSTASQILLMRELIVVFYGNELSLGIMLAGWLFWVGVGSLIAAQLAPRFEALGRPWALALIQILLGMAPLATLLCARAIPLYLRQASAGEIIGYIPIVVSSFLLLAPLCILLGFLFDIFCHAWSNDEDSALSIGSVYVFEAIGAAIGGVAFAMLLVKFLDPTLIACVLLLISISAAAATLIGEGRLRPSGVAISAFTMILAGAVFFGGAAKLNSLSLEWLWQRQEVVFSDDSIYGNIAYIEEGEQKSLYENGLLMLSHPDRFSAEESVHFALLEHTSPNRVLLIGGGVSGSLGEALKHPVERIDYLELDPLVIDTVGRYFPKEIAVSIEDPRVSVHNIDGRLFIKEIREPYDVIIINLPDPYTAMINRFYTVEFFRECKANLSAGGILSFRVSSAENYISPELQQFLGCLNKTLLEVFSNVKVVPGESNIFLACEQKDVLTLDSGKLIHRLESRRIRDKVLFIREYYLPFRLSEERRERLDAALAAAEPRINTDLSPICYYYHAVLWSKQFEDISGKILASISRIRPYWILGAIAAIFAVALAIQWFFPVGWGSKSILVAVGTTGFAEISIEVVTLLGFQAIHGYVYYEMAIIITAFMIGLAVGAALMGRLIRRGLVDNRAFLLIQALVCLYPVLLLGFLIISPKASGAGAIAFQTHAVFSLLAFLAGFVGGLQFPLANALWLAETPGIARAAGLTYGVDLLGSCIGALLTTTLLIPVFGIPFACIIASSLNFGSLLLLIIRRRHF